MVGGEIKVVMTLDNGQFIVQTMKAGKAIYSVKKSLDDTASSVKALETKFTSFGQKFQDITLRISLLRFALRDVYDIFLRIPKAILDTSGRFERMTALLKGMSKATTEAGKELEAISEKKYIINLALNSPFNIESIQDSFVKMKSVGIDPTNGSVKALVDSVAKFGGTPELLKRASIAIQQMVGKGVVSMEELRQQLGEAMPDAMQKMAQGLGATVPEMVKQVSLGVVQATNAVNNMLAIMAVDNLNAANEMAKTWPGLMEQIKTKTTLIMNDIGNAGFLEAMKEEVNKLLVLMDSMDIRALAVSIGEAFAAIVGGAVATIEFFQKWGKEIKTVATLLATLYVAKSINGLLAGLAARMAAIRSSATLEVAQTQATEENKERLLLKSLSNRMLMEKAAYQQKGVQLQQEMTRQIAHQAQMAAAEARALAVSGQMRRAGGGLNANQAEAARQIAWLRAQGAATDAYIVKLRAEAAAHLANSGAMATEGRARALSIVALNNTGRAMTAMKGIMVGMGTAFAAMGGWVTVLTALIIVGTMKVIEWGNRAKEAAQKAKDAAAGLTSVEDAIAHAEKLKEKAGKLAQSEQNLKFVETSPNYSEATKAAARASFAREQLEYAQLLKDNTNFKNSATGVAIREQITAWNHGTDLWIAARKADMEKTTLVLQAESEKDPTINNSKKLKDARVGFTTTVINELLRQSAIDNAKLLKATGENKVRLAAFKEARDAQIEEWTARRKGLVDGGNMVLVGGGKSKSKSEAEKTDHWAVAIQNLKEKMADLNGELNKKGSGDMLKLIEDLSGKGVNMGAENSPIANVLIETAKNAKTAEEKIAALKAIFDDLGQKELALKISESSFSVLDKAEQQLASLMETSEGGSSAVAVLRREIHNLLAQAQNTDTIERLTKALHTLENVSTLEDNKKFMKSYEAYLDYANQAKQIELGMLDDHRDMLRQQYALDEAAEKAKLELKRTAQGMTAAAYDLEFQGLALKQAALFAKLQRDSETPMQKTLREWQNTTAAMENATGRWLGEATNAFIQFAQTGKLEFRSLAASILKEIAAIMMKKAIAGIVSMAIGAFAGGFGATAAAGTAMGGLGTTAFSTQSMQLAGQVFANGGIMTSAGSVALKKYANGGIANSPQLALYGEGRTPEAYVPLPDGRSIPVTMSGGSGGSSVAINITVYESGEENSKTEGDAQKDMWKEMGNRVKGVVLNELAIQKRPGGMLYS